MSPLPDLMGEAKVAWLQAQVAALTERVSKLETVSRHVYAGGTRPRPPEDNPAFRLIIDQSVQAVS